MCNGACSPALNVKFAGVIEGAVQAGILRYADFAQDDKRGERSPDDKREDFVTGKRGGCR